MIEEYNHGKEFPALKSLPGLHFRRRAGPREPSKSDAALTRFHDSGDVELIGCWAAVRQSDRVTLSAFLFFCFSGA